MTTGELRLLASGREADVFALDGGRVLRRYRGGEDVADEAAVMAYAAAYGYPVPSVYEADGPDLVMERLDGPTMAEMLLGGGLAVDAAAGRLADLHARLHALPPRMSRERDARIVHLDLHPENVILSSRGPVLIDWGNATDGPPDLDVAISALILAEVAVGSHLPPEVAPLVRELLSAFLTATVGDPLEQLGRAQARRTANPTLSADEVGRLDEAAALVRRAATERGGRRGLQV